MGADKRAGQNRSERESFGREKEFGVRSKYLAFDADVACPELDSFPSPLGHWVPAFVEFDMVDQGFDWFSGEAAFLDALGKDVAAFVAPAELNDEAVPHMTFFVGARRAVGMRPRQHGFIVLAGERKALNLRVGDAEKAAATSVESEELRVAQVIVIRGRELARGMEADFIQHSPEINETPDFIVATAQTRNVWHGQTSVRADAVASFEIGNRRVRVRSKYLTFAGREFSEKLRARMSKPKRIQRSRAKGWENAGERNPMRD
jgi:hypothetical protein